MQTFDSYLSGGPARDSIFVDCSTVAPTTTSELASRATDSGEEAGPCFHYSLHGATDPKGRAQRSNLETATCTRDRLRQQLSLCVLHGLTIRMEDGMLSDALQ